MVSTSRSGVTELDSSDPVATPATILREILDMNVYNSVFVDCTSSAEIAALYPALLDHNVNVVAANKKAASSSYADYLNLKEIARRRDVKFLSRPTSGPDCPSSTPSTTSSTPATGYRR